MKRRSALPVLIRLARLEESRALQGLGRSRAVVAEIGAAVEHAEQAYGATRAGVVLKTGTRLEAAHLALLAQSGRGLEQRLRELERRLGGAHSAEEAARVVVVETKLRVRAFERAQASRTARARMEARRVETRRMDETTRALREAERAAS